MYGFNGASEYQRTNSKVRGEPMYFSVFQFNHLLSEYPQSSWSSMVPNGEIIRLLEISTFIHHFIGLAKYLLTLVSATYKAPNFPSLANEIRTKNVVNVSLASILVVGR